MPEHIKAYDNMNKPIVGRNHNLLPQSFFNIVRLRKDEYFQYHLEDYESVCVLASGSVDIQAQGKTFESLGKRNAIFGARPEAAYIPIDTPTTIRAISTEVEVFIAGGRYEKKGEAFRIDSDDVVTVQYGSDDTKTHRKIFHVLGQDTRDRVGRLLVSELFTVGAGGWSGFPPHKHDEDRGTEETAFEEIYHFRFNPAGGFAAQFCYVHEHDFGPVHHVKQGSNILLDKGYHPVVVAPGYEMYYFTILVGKTQQSLIQHFEPAHAYQLKTIPGIMDMVNKFK